MQQFLLATVIDPIHYLDLEENFVHLTQLVEGIFMTRQRRWWRHHWRWQRQQSLLGLQNLPVSGHPPPHPLYSQTPG